MEAIGVPFGLPVQSARAPSAERAAAQPRALIFESPETVKMLDVDVWSEGARRRFWQALRSTRSRVRIEARSTRHQCWTCSAKCPFPLLAKGKLSANLRADKAVNAKFLRDLTGLTEQRTSTGNSAADARLCWTSECVRNECQSLSVDFG